MQGHVKQAAPAGRELPHQGNGQLNIQKHSLERRRHREGQLRRALGRRRQLHRHLLALVLRAVMGHGWRAARGSWGRVERGAGGWRRVAARVPPKPWGRAQRRPAMPVAGAAPDLPPREPRWAPPAPCRAAGAAPPRRRRQRPGSLCAGGASFRGCLGPAGPRELGGATARQQRSLSWADNGRSKSGLGSRSCVFEPGPSSRASCRRRHRPAAPQA